MFQKSLTSKTCHESKYGGVERNRLSFDTSFRINLKKIFCHKVDTKGHSVSFFKKDTFDNF